MFAWSTTPDPKEAAKKWKAEMRAEMRKIDRAIAKIEREQTKVKQSVKQAAKRNDTSSAKTLAKEIVRSRKAVSRMHTSKAQMNSVLMQMQNQLAQQKMVGKLSKSSEIMLAMNRLVKVESIQATMQNMQKEMVKAGVIEEMMDDAMDANFDEEDEDAADEEVSKVLNELAVAQTGGMSSAPSKAVATASEAADDKAVAAVLEGLRG